MYSGSPPHKGFQHFTFSTHDKCSNYIIANHYRFSLYEGERSNFLRFAFPFLKEMFAFDYTSEQRYYSLSTGLYLLAAWSFLDAILAGNTEKSKERVKFATKQPASLWTSIFLFVTILNSIQWIECRLASSSSSFQDIIVIMHTHKK